MLKKKKGVCYPTHVYVHMSYVYVMAVQAPVCRVSRSNCQSVGTHLQFADSYPT
jgi:hypothetical protein